jgi:hypothetical protein
MPASVNCPGPDMTVIFRQNELTRREPMDHPLVGALHSGYETKGPPQCAATLDRREKRTLID